MPADEVLAILDTALKQEVSLSDIQEVVLCQCWQGKTYSQIAESFGYDDDYIRDVGFRLWQTLSRALGEKVTKSNFQSVLRRRQSSPEGSVDVPVHQPLQPHRRSSRRPKLLRATAPIAAPAIASKRQDWGEAIDVSIFYGRTTELTTLSKWIVEDRCRLVSVVGMGGIGKTALSIKLAEQVQEQFEYLVWRSLRNTPLIEDILTDLLQVLSDQQATLPKDLEAHVTQLIQHLRDSRCLIVLDNAETILRAGDSTGHYREGYEAYGEVLKRVGEAFHQSCCVLVSREKFKEVTLLEGEKLPIRSFQLAGLRPAAAQQIFAAKGNFSGSEADWSELVEHYAGNPLALKIVAPTIQEFFESDVAKFLAYLRQGSLVFDDIRSLLDRQFNRLSDLEKQVMYWLAINREWTSLSELQADIVSSQNLVEVLHSLLRRSLIHKNAIGFTQQPVVMQYMTERLIEQVSTEITTGNINLLASHALLKAQAKDYIRDGQGRMILQPLIEKLSAHLGTNQDIERQLRQLLIKLQAAPFGGYAGGNILNLLRHLNSDLSGYDLSGLTIWQAYLQDITLHQVNFAEADLSKSVFAETFGSILSVAFSPDGKLLATSDTNGEIRLWQLAERCGGAEPFGKLLLSYQGHSSWTLSVIFSPDGRTLASSSVDQTVKLWDVDTGKCRKVFQGHDNWVWSVAFSPDGRTLASSSFDQTVKLWDVDTGKCLRTFQGHTSRVWSVAFSPDGRTLASSSFDQTVKLWDIVTGQCLRTLQEQAHFSWSCAFSPDGVTLASISKDHAVKLWNIETGSYKMLQGHTSWVLSVTFSPDGSKLATGSNDHTVKSWDARTGKCLRTLAGHTNRVWSVAFSPDGVTLASSSEDQTVKIWNTQTGQCLRTRQGYTSRISSVAFSPDGKTLASGSEDRTVKLWDTHTGKCLKRLLGHSSWVWCVIFSPDGYILASSSEDGTVRMWDVSSGECLRTLNGHSSAVSSVAFSPDGRTLASSSVDQTVKLWDASTGECVRTLRGHSNWVHTVSFSPNGQLLASSSEDQTIRLWDASSGKCLQILHGHGNRVFSVAFNPDDQMLASGSQDETIRIWDTKLAKCVKTLRAERPYEGMNINSVKGLTTAQRSTLKALGAVEDELSARTSRLVS